VEEILDGLVRIAMRNPLITIFIVLSILGALGKKGSDAARRSVPPRQPPIVRAPGGGADDLEERVRRNFEEMMRRRAMGSPAPGPHPAPVPAPTAARVRRTTEPTVIAREANPPLHPVPYATVSRTRGELAPLPGLRAPSRMKVPTAARTGFSAMSSSPILSSQRRSLRARLARPDPRLDARAAARDRRELRRLVVMREVLDPPVALRG
jgi:hypothetical protein